MGRYIQQSDIESFHGINNINTWADLDNDGEADPGRIDLAIAFAEDWIDDMFRGGRYAIPFAFRAGIPETVKHWAVVLSGNHLYQARGQRDEDAGERLRVLVEGEEGSGGVLGMIRDYHAGKWKLNAEQVEQQPEAPIAIF